MRSQLAQDIHGGGLVVHEDASLAARRNFATQDDGIVFAVEPVAFENLSDGFFGGAICFEDGSDHGAVGSRADDIGGGFLSEEQGESIDQDRFASASFAGQEVESSGEFDRQVVNDCVVFQPQFHQHESASARS